MSAYEGQVEHFGIDFGTTNIAVSGLIIDKDTRRAFRIHYCDENKPFPAIVAIKDDCEHGKSLVKFGRDAKVQLGKLQDDGFTVFRSIKTELGRDIEYSVGALRLHPEAIVTCLIKAIKQFLVKKTVRKVDITSATVAVPVDFTNAQRKKLQEAFKNAGVKVNKIISESLAAYIRNREYVENLSNVVVFDWGGGTLDVSLIEVQKNKAKELETTGLNKAGDKIDEAIAEFVHNKLVCDDKYHINVSFRDISAGDRTKILIACENAKISDFSDAGDEPALIYMIDYCGEKKVTYNLTYKDFAAIVMKFVSEAIGKIGEVLVKANKSLIDLNAIIMVGGSSNLLPLKNLMIEEFEKKRGKKLIHPDNPEWSVAEGAAIIDSIDCQYELNQDIGIVMSDGSVFPIIPRGARVPYNGEPVSFGTVDNSTSANFIVADSNGNIRGKPIIVNVKDFLGEYFEVSGMIENSLIATIVVKSNKMMGGRSYTKEINELSFVCDISEIEDFEIKNDES